MYDTVYVIRRVVPSQIHLVHGFKVQILIEKVKVRGL